MLRHLIVKNFAILEELEVSFEDGMNVLTGETGAGKSLLIGAIGLLLGDRADTDVVRTGAESAEVSGLFSPLNKAVEEVLTKQGISLEEDGLLIKRRVSKDKGNLIKVNGEAVTLAELRKITRRLADIHTQHDTKRLINPETYLALLDGYDETIGELLEAYRIARKDYLEAYEAHEGLLQKRQATEEKADLLRFQADELHSHELKKGEEEELENRLKALKNFDEIYRSLAKASSALDEKEALENIYEAKDALEEAARYDKGQLEKAQRIESAYLELDDIRQSLADELASLDFDPGELDRLETRKHTLETLKRKYQKTVDELVDYQEEIAETLSDAETFDERITAAEKRLKASHADIRKKAEHLSEARKKAARAIETRMEDELSALELQEAAFEIRLTRELPEDERNRDAFRSEGIDRVDFLLSTNKGEPRKPLRQIASGGELSRIMLALKTLLVKQETLNLMVFDEIDTGVSGFVAAQVAKKMHELAKDVQVLSITHLPQVAAAADTHYLIHKESGEERTAAHVRPLDETGRIDELAKMISGDEVTERAKASAKDLLK